MFTASSLRAQTNAGEEVLKLLPPYGEIPPSFWEQHGIVIGWIAVAIVLLIAIIIALRLRPRPGVIIPPEVQARAALNALASRPEDGRVLSEVSQIVRRYFVAAFQLPPEEATTSEFCRALSGNERIGGELAAAVSDFLKQCDVRKFSPSPDASPTSAVLQALTLIDKAESRRAALAQTSAATRA